MPELQVRDMFGDRTFGRITKRAELVIVDRI